MMSSCTPRHSIGSLTRFTSSTSGTWTCFPSLLNFNRHVFTWAAIGLCSHMQSLIILMLTFWFWLTSSSCPCHLISMTLLANFHQPSLTGSRTSQNLKTKQPALLQCLLIGLVVSPLVSFSSFFFFFNFVYLFVLLDFGMIPNDGVGQTACSCTKG